MIEWLYFCECYKFIIKYDTSTFFKQSKSLISAEALSGGKYGVVCVFMWDWFFPWPGLGESEAGVDSFDRNLLLSYGNHVVLMLTSFYLRMKSTEVCVKTKPIPFKC